MKVVICQPPQMNQYLPPRELLIEEWKKELADVPGIELVFKEPFSPDKLDEQVGDADAFVGLRFTDGLVEADFFERHPKLKYIGTFSHGFGKFDMEASRQHGVTVTNTIYGDMTIAQFGMGLLLDICHNVDIHAQKYRENTENGTYTNSTRVQSRQIELYGKTMGIYGLGHIGLWTARMAAGFGMHVIGYSRHKKTDPEYDFIEQVSRDELFARSDVISINCPLTDETYHSICKETIAGMKDGVIIINTARGAIINESDLMEALKSGKVYAAGLDVVEGEPLQKPSPLMYFSNTRVTPHVAFATSESRYRSVKIAAQNLKNWIAGHPSSVINQSA